MISEDYSRSDNIIKSFNWCFRACPTCGMASTTASSTPLSGCSRVGVGNCRFRVGKTHVTRLLCTSDYSPKTTMTIQGMIMSESSFPEVRILSFAYA